MVRLGLNCKLFRGTAGTKASTLMKNVKDVTMSMETGEADVTTRATNGWRAYAATLKDSTIEFGMNYDTGDADLEFINDAFLNNTTIALFIENGDGSGLDIDAVITQFNVSQPLEEAETVEVRARIAAGRAPEWVDASTSN